MSNIAVILAGGSGKRMGADVPKQFVSVFDKPLLIYTLEGFQNHPQIDAIEVVVKKGWEKVVEAYSKQFNITKLQWITEGGETVQESIRNGVFNLETSCEEDDIIVIHDGIRPLIDIEVLTDILSTAERYGNSIASLPYNEQMFLADDENPMSTREFIPRETIRKVATPQAFCFGKIDSIYHRAFDEGRGIDDSCYADTLMVDYGEKLHFALGSDRNIKISTRNDLELFKSYLKTEKGKWIK